MPSGDDVFSIVVVYAALPFIAHQPSASQRIAKLYKCAFRRQPSLCYLDQAFLINHDSLSLRPRLGASIHRG